MHEVYTIFFAILLLLLMCACLWPKHVAIDVFNALSVCMGVVWMMNAV